MWLTDSWIGAVARWASFSGTAMVIGVLGARVVARSWPDVAATSRVQRLVRVGAAAVLGSAVLRLAQQALAFAAAPPEAWAMVGVLLRTPWGYAWSAQVFAAALVAVAPAQVASGTRYALAAGCALAIGAAPAFQGHAFGAPAFMAQAVIADVVHVVASGLWVGTLAVLAVTTFARGAGADVLRIVTRFSRLALGSAMALGMTGVFAGWLHVPSPDLLLTTPYGRLLLIKLGLVAITAGFGAWNWKRVTPRLREPDGVPRLRRSVRGELLVAALVMAVTAVLVATALPGE